MAETLSELATRHVREGRRIVAWQKEIIAIHELAGHNTEQHERLLETFEGTLRIFEEHEREISGRLAKLERAAYRGFRQTKRHRPVRLRG